MFNSLHNNSLAFQCVQPSEWRCAASMWVTGSIPESIIGIFHWHNPSGRTMTLGLTQPLTEMSTSNIYCGKGVWQPHHFHVLIVLKSGNLNLLEPLGPLQAGGGIALHFIFLQPTKHIQTVPFQSPNLMQVTCSCRWGDSHTADISKYCVLGHRVVAKICLFMLWVFS